MTALSPTADERTAPRIRLSPLRGAVVVGAAAVLVFVLSTSGFLTVGNLKSIAVLSGFGGIMALGQTVIMINGCFFSLSLGTTLATSACMFIALAGHGLGLAIPVTLAYGIVVSALQGYFVGAWGANPIILTIGISAIMLALGTILTNGSQVSEAAHGPSLHFLSAPVGGVALPFYAFVVMVVIMHLVMVRTRLGAYIMLVGENRSAARAAGLPVTGAIVGAFCLAGLCAAVTAILLASFNNSSADLTIDGTLQFDAIAAALLAGTVVSGGRGSMLATFAGMIGLEAIQSSLLLRNYSNEVQGVVEGGIVLVAVVIVHLWRRESQP